MKLKIPGNFFKSNPELLLHSNAFSIFHNFFMIADLLNFNHCNWYIAKVKNYNLNVTEVRDSDFKNAFPGIFNFTVGILVKLLPYTYNLLLSI